MRRAVVAGWIAAGSLLYGARAPGAEPTPAGRAIYVAKCQACHGATGKGDGPAARALQRPPRDFSQPTFWASRTDDQVKAVIRTGYPGPITLMRGFPMPEAQLDDLVVYLRTFEVR